MLGKKILIIGVSASGKSYFARKLAAKTALPLVHIDSLMWKPGWEYVGDQETSHKLDTATRDSEWILEGFLIEKVCPFVFERADSVIFLDYSAFTKILRYAQRWWRHRTHARPELEGSPERWYLFLVAIFNRYKRLSRGEQKIPLRAWVEMPGIKEKTIRFTSPKEAEHFLNKL